MPPKLASMRPDAIVSVEPRLLKLKTAAGILDISLATLRTFIKDGKIRSIKVGRQCRIKTTELSRFIESLDAAAEVEHA